MVGDAQRKRSAEEVGMMSHFYGYLTGGRGTATRTGHKTTGISATLTTWGEGVEVRLYHDAGRDHFRVTRTSKSGREEPLAEGVLNED